MPTEEPEDCKYIRSIYEESKQYYSSKKQEIVDAWERYKQVRNEDIIYPGRTRMASSLVRRTVEIIYPRLRSIFMADGRLRFGAELVGDSEQGRTLEEVAEAYSGWIWNTDMDAYEDICDFVKQGVIAGTSMVQRFWDKDNKCEEIQALDIFDVYPEAGCRSLRDVKRGKCSMVIRERLTVAEFKSLVDQGIYEEIDAYELASAASQIKDLSEGERSQVNNALAYGPESSFSPSVTELAFDADESGYIYLLHEWKGKHVKTINGSGPATYTLRDKEWTGPFPFYAWRFYPSPFEFFGEGVGELLRWLHKEHTVVRNQRRDMENLNVNGMYKYQTGVNIDFYSLQNPRPGGLVAMDDQGAVSALDPPGGEAIAHTFNEENVIHLDVDTLMQISDFQRGTLTSKNMTRTASGISQIINEANTKIDEGISDLGKVLSDMCTDVFYDYRKKKTQAEWVKVLGTKGIQWEQIRPDEIKGEFKFVMKMDKMLGDKTLKLNNRIMLLRELTNYRDIVDVSPVLASILKLADMENVDQIVRPTLTVALDPDTENMLLSKGYPVTVHKEDDHQTHIAIHAQLGAAAESHNAAHYDAMSQGGVVSSMTGAEQQGQQAQQNAPNQTAAMPQTQQSMGQAQAMMGGQMGGM